MEKPLKHHLKYPFLPKQKKNPKQSENLPISKMNSQDKLQQSEPS